MNRSEAIGQPARVAGRLGWARPTVARIATVLGVGPRFAVAGLLVGVVLIAIVTGIAIRTGLLVPILGAAAALPIVLASVRWPVLPLFAFALLTPVEEIVVIGPLGSLSRYAEILFIVAYGLPRLGKLTIGAMPAAAWAYVAWATLSVGWAIDRNATLTELPILGLLFTTAVVLAALVVERPSIVRPLLWAYTVSAGLMAIAGLVAFATSGAVPGPNDRAAALADQNPAYYAALLLPAFVFSLYEFLSGRIVILSSSIAALAGLAIIASGTRAVWAGATVAVFLFILPRLTPARRLATLGLFAALVIGALQVPGLAKIVVDRATIAVSTGGAGRTDIWTVGMTIYESAPLTGVGLANFPIAYTPERVRKSDVGIYSATNPAYRAPHNIAIGTLGELGPFGLLLLAAFLGPLVLRRGSGPEAGVIQAAMASLVTTAFFLDVLNRKWLWLVIGMACGLAFLAARERMRAFGERASGSAAAGPGAAGPGAADPARAGSAGAGAGSVAARTGSR